MAAWRRRVRESLFLLSRRSAARAAARRRSSTTAACARCSRAEIENIIRNGMPNGMPPFGSLPEADLQAVTDLRAVVQLHPRSIFEPAGDVAAGESFFFGKGQCASCHIARGRGAAGGPDLSNIGRQMTRARVDESARRAGRRDCAGIRDRARAVEGRPHAARIRSQRRQPRAAAADGRWPPRRGRQTRSDHHARDRLGDAAAERDRRRNARSDRVSRAGSGGTVRWCDRCTVRQVRSGATGCPPKREREGG